MKASTRSAVPAFHALDMLNRANALEAEGRAICHLEIGQPTDPMPAEITAVAMEALRTDLVGYTEATGKPAFREALSRHYAAWYGLDIPPERFIATTGASGGFVLAFLAAFDAGDRVGLLTPGYPAYRNILLSLGLEPVTIEAGEGEGWEITADAIAATHEEKPLNGMLIASPNNPTGKVIEADDLRAITGYCREAGIKLISDEIYHGLTYDAPAPSVLSSSDDVIVVSSFSKYFRMTGWRIGWLVVHDAMIRPIERLAQNLFICPPALSQVVATAALDQAALFEPVKARYARNRVALQNGLTALGFPHIAPMDGAFYTYADVGAFANDSMTFAKRALEELGIAITPGADFDTENGHRYVRLSYAGANDHIDQALERFKGWL